MSLTTAKRAIDETLKKKPDRVVSIHFFGGEPLLCGELISEIVDYCETLDAHFDFHISTNGLLLQDEVLVFLRRHGFRILISWDGLYPDSCRKWPDGSNTTKDVLESIERAADAFAAREDCIQVRITVTRFTQRLQDSIDTLFRVGVRRFVLKDVADNALGFTSTQRKQAIRLYDDLATHYANCVINSECFYLYGRATGFTTILKDLNRYRPRKQGCDCGVSRVTVLPSGNYVPCSRYADEGSSIGSIYSGLVNGYDTLYKATGAPKECKECFARFICGGVCHGAARLHQAWTPPNGEQCVLTRHRVMRAIALRHQFHEAGIDDEFLTGMPQ